MVAFEGCTGRERAGDPMKQPAVEAIFATARAEGAGPALDSLAAAIARDSALAPLGHHVAHSVGRYLVALRGFSPELLASCRPTYQAGCYHGVLEEHVARLPGGLDSAQIRALCQVDGSQAPIVALECAHGFGHGAFTRAEAHLGPALESCDAMEAGVLVRECQDGVFMERLVASRHDGREARETGRTGRADETGDSGANSPHQAHAAASRADSAAWSCDTVEPHHRPACWAYQPAAIVARTPVSADSLASICFRLEPMLADECWRGMGKLWATWKGIAGGRLVTDACARKGATAESACVRGVTESLVDLDWSGKLGEEFCGSRAADSGKCLARLRERLVLTSKPTGY